MSNRDDYRGYRGADRREWRRDAPGQGGERQGAARDEPRYFGQAGRGDDQRGRYNSDEARYGAAPRGGQGEGEREPWRRDRYGSRFDQDRVDYGSGYDPQAGGYGAGYAGQEYGVESGAGREREGRRGGQDHSRETWRQGGPGAPYGDLELNARNSGVQDFGAPHDYAYHPPQGHEFDPEYVSWRDQQLAAHDKDYAEWRRHQHEQYDNAYRSFREEKRGHFHKTFSEWRSQREAQASGDNAAVPPSAEFGSASPPVQAASDGETRRATGPAPNPAADDHATDADRKH